MKVIWCTLRLPANAQGWGTTWRCRCPQSSVAAERHIALVVFCRPRYRLTLRDLSEIMLLLGFTISHESIRRLGGEAAARDGRGAT